MDKIHQLKLFCLVAEKQSFAQAAIQLGLPRSTVSHAIKRLEQEYEVLLFYRTTRKVGLTYEGHLFYLETMQLIEQLGELNRFKNTKSSNHGKIRIGLPKRIATEILLPNLQQYYAKYPKVKILLNSQDQYSNLVEQGLDCVIRVGAVQSDLLLARFIGMTALVTLASAEYLQKKGMPESETDLSLHKIIEYRVEKKMRNTSSSYLCFQHKKVVVNYDLLVEDTTSYVSAGLLGLGIIQIPQFDAAHLIKQNVMISILDTWQPCMLPVHILVADRKYRPEYLNDFLDWLENLLKSVVRLNEWNNPTTNNEHDT